MIAEMLDADLPLSQLGEGAYWSKENSTLYWVDIAGRTVHAYHLPDKVHSSWRLSKEVSFVFPHLDGRLLVGLSDGVYEYDPESGEEAPVALLDLPSGHRLNDGKLDPTGRLWVGTINTADEPSETAALYVPAGRSTGGSRGWLRKCQWEGLEPRRYRYVSRRYQPRNDMGV